MPPAADRVEGSTLAASGGPYRILKKNRAPLPLMLERFLRKLAGAVRPPPPPTSARDPETNCILQSVVIKSMNAYKISYSP